MPDFDKKPWSDLLPFLREEVLPVLAIAIAAIIAFRLARLFVHGIVKTLLDREATEGTAQELSAVELKKRMDTLDALGANTLQFFIVIIAGLMILGTIGLDIGPAVAGLGVVGIAVGFGAQFLVRDYLNGSLILIENQFGGATSSGSPGSAARSRTSPCAGRRCATSTASSTPSRTARSRSPRT